VLSHWDSAGLEDAAGGAPADGVAEAHTPERVADAGGGDVAAAGTASVPTAPATVLAGAPAPERTADGQRGAATAPLTGHGGAVQSRAEAHAREGDFAARGAMPTAGTTRAECQRLTHLYVRMLAAPMSAAPLPLPAEARAPEHAADLWSGGATALRAADGDAVQPQAEAHAPEGGPAAAGATPVGTNRAAHRQLKYLQRRLRRRLAACLRA